MMTVDKAHAVLVRRLDENNPPDIVPQLRARARLWRNGTMPEHAEYCDDAADEIERLRAEVQKYKDREMALVRLAHDPNAI
jgi:hypothetical protein